MFAHREQSKWFHQFGRPSSLRMDQLDGSGLRRVPHNAQATSSLALTPIAAGSGRVTDGSVLAARELPPTRHEWDSATWVRRRPSPSSRLGAGVIVTDFVPRSLF